MKRTNTFAVRPLSAADEQLLRELLEASAALWNDANYERLVRYDDQDGLEDEGVWAAPTGSLEGTYKGVLGASTAQQVNTEELRLPASPRPASGTSTRAASCSSGSAK